MLVVHTSYYYTTTVPATVPLTLYHHTLPHCTLHHCTHDGAQRDASYGWMLRSMHANMASGVFGAMYLHATRA